MRACDSKPLPLLALRLLASSTIAGIAEGVTSMRLALELAIIVILLLFNAVLAASELAIVSARKPRLRTMADDGIEAARRVLAIQEQPTRFLAAIQVGITLAGFFASAVGAVSLVDKFSRCAGGRRRQGDCEQQPPYRPDRDYCSPLVRQHHHRRVDAENDRDRDAETIAMRMAKPIDALSRISGAVIHLLTAASNVLIRALGGPGAILAAERDQAGAARPAGDARG